MLYLLCFQLQAQSKLDVFLAQKGGAGLRTQPASIYPEGGLGWSTDFKFLTQATDTIIPTPYQLNWGIDLGLTWDDQLFFFTGVNYTARYDRGVPVCDVCGLVYNGGPILLRNYFWEIPIGLNFLFTTQKSINPFIGASAFYTFSTKWEYYQSWAFQWRLGASIPLGQTTSFQLSLYTQGNRRASERPYYIFREAGMQLSLVKIFRKS